MIWIWFRAKLRRRVKDEHKVFIPPNESGACGYVKAVVNVDLLLSSSSIDRGGRLLSKSATVFATGKPIYWSSYDMVGQQRNSQNVDISVCE